MGKISFKNANVVICNCFKHLLNEDDMNERKEDDIGIILIIFLAVVKYLLHETRIHVHRLHTAISKLFFTPRARSSTSWDWRKEVELEVLREVNQKESEVREIGIPREVFSSPSALSGINRKFKKNSFLEKWIFFVVFRLYEKQGTECVF